MKKALQEYFKGKRITQLGLGLLGRGLGDALFLASMGAELTITDNKSAKELKTSLKALEKFPTITFTLGEHKMEDFEKKDFILKAAGVAIDSPYILHAKEKGIPVEMDASLSVKLLRHLGIQAKVIGVTGTRGKTTTTELIVHILKLAKMKAHLGGNIRGLATLPLVPKIKDGDYLVLELDSWQLQGFRDAKISPHIAVFTSFMADHLNYYKGSIERYFHDKAAIYQYQEPTDKLIVTSTVKKYMKGGSLGKLQIATKDIVPADWKPRLLGEHNLENIACAILASRAIGVSDDIIKKGVETFDAIEGRLEKMPSKNGVEIYNDNNSTTPDATMVALKSVSPRAASGKVTLIMGGADKTLDMSKLVKILPAYVKKIVFLPGTGTEKLMADYELKVANSVAKNLKEAVKEAMSKAEKGDVVLFSTAFASFGLFVNEYDRGDQFKKIIKGLK